MKKIFMNITTLASLSVASLVSAAPVGSDAMSPVAFTSFKTNMPDAKSSVIMRSLSKHVGSALADVYATETIGSTSTFSPKLETAVLGSAGYALGEIDKSIELKVMPEINSTLVTLGPDETVEFQVDALWADHATADSLPQGALVPPAVIAILRMNGQPDIASLLSLHWVDGDASDANGSIRGRLKTTSELARLRRAFPGQWLPWSNTLTFSITRAGVQIHMESLVLPVMFSKAQRIEKPGVTITNVSYIPEASEVSGSFDLTKIDFKRLYATSRGSEIGALHITFGEWAGNYFKVCQGNECLKRANRVPTIHGTVKFDESSWWDSFIGWFRSWVVTEVYTEIMLQDLWLDYNRDTNQLSIVPSKSAIPIIVSSNALFSGGDPFMLNDQVGYLGINFYERYVGTQIADGLSADLNRSLAEADKSLAELISQLAGGVVR